MSIRQIRVLLVEDDEISAQAARTVLERLGCSVDTASNGEEAIELFRKETYDLVLMDWQMPQMDGLETTARLRRMPQGRVTPIVGNTASMSRLECLAAGLNDVMPKPFLFTALKTGLAKWTLWEENCKSGTGQICRRRTTRIRW
jgi:two-component system, sensor histidine kinase and response regulator